MESHSHTDEVAHCAEVPYSSQETYTVINALTNQNEVRLVRKSNIRV